MNGTGGIPIQNTEIDFILQLLATLIGVITGFLLIALYEKKKKQKELKNTQKVFLESLTSEIDQMVNGFENMKGKLKWVKKEKRFVGSYADTSLASFENALNSGNMILLSPKLQIKLAILNDIIKSYKFFLLEALSFYKIQFTDEKRQAEDADVLFRNMNNSLDNYYTELKEVQASLESEYEKLEIN